MKGVGLSRSLFFSVNAVYKITWNNSDIRSKGGKKKKIWFIINQFNNWSWESESYYKKLRSKHFQIITDPIPKC